MFHSNMFRKLIVYLLLTYHPLLYTTAKAYMQTLWHICSIPVVAIIELLEEGGVCEHQLVVFMYVIFKAMST